MPRDARDWLYTASSYLSNCYQQVVHIWFEPLLHHNENYEMSSFLANCRIPAWRNRTIKRRQSKMFNPLRHSLSQIINNNSDVILTSSYLLTSREQVLYLNEARDFLGKTLLEWRNISFCLTKHWILTMHNVRWLSIFLCRSDFIMVFVSPSFRLNTKRRGTRLLRVITILP